MGIPVTDRSVVAGERTLEPVWSAAGGHEARSEVVAVVQLYGERGGGGATRRWRLCLVLETDSGDTGLQRGYHGLNTGYHGVIMGLQLGYNGVTTGL